MSLHWLSRGVVLLLAFISFGCATIVNKDIVSVPVYTDPPGARLFVAGRAYHSPDVIKVPRGQGDFILTIEKPGYRAERIILRESLDTWLGWNLVFPGFPFMIDDLANKRAYDLEPEIVKITLVKEPS